MPKNYDDTDDENLTEDDVLVMAVRKEMNRLRGRLAGFLEAVGMPEKQERGAVATLKSLSYDSEAVIIELILGED